MSSHNSREQHGFIRYLVTLPLLLLLMYWGWDNYERRAAELYQQRAHDEVFRELIEVMDGLEELLNDQLMVALTIESLVYTQGGIEAGQFEVLAQKLWRRGSGEDGVRSLQVSVGTTVRHVYPLEGNEAVIGLDLLTIEGQADTVRRTIAGRDLVIAGPYDLVQGGRGLIARKPIYLSERDGGGYWGLATVLLDWDALVQASGIASADGLELTLRRLTPSGEVDSFLYGEAAHYDKTVSLQVTLPDAAWLLTARPKGGWPDVARQLLPERVIFTLLTLLLLLVVVIALRYPEVLEQRVRSATRALETSRSQLERRVAERTAALSESETQIRRLFDALPFSLIITALDDGEVLYANDSAVTLFEESPAWQGVKAPDYYVNPEERANFVALLRRDGAVSNFEVEMHTAKGRRFWCLASAVRSDYNGRAALLVSHADITARRRVEQARILSEQNLRTIFDSLPTPMAITRNSDGKLMRINRAGMMLSGLADVPLEDFRAEDFYCDPQDRERVMALLQRDSRVNDFEICMHSLKGERHTFLMSATFVTYDNEPCLLSSYAEITERKKMELALRQANREAQQAIEAKNAFLATMSHEIRTPLNGALSMVKLLGQTELDAQQREYLRAIDFSGESLLQILSDVLDLSKLEAGKLELEQANFNLPRMVDEMAALMRMQHARQGVELSATIDLRIPTWLRGDATRLRQVLFNLLGNALKFTERGEVRLQADFKYERNGSLCIEFAVTDTGIGIDQEAQSRLFGDFTQADSSVARRFGGSGLGLAICKRMVELMGGEIGVESELGEGSRFWFTVELQRGGKPEEDRIGRVTLSGQVLRVLLVEDDAINRVAGSALLRQQGCEVTTAADGYEALQRFHDGIFDVVLMDVRMPGMDGLETTRRLRELEPYGSDVPVVALTADVTQENIERCHAVGMQEVLSKPIRMERLSEVLAGLAPPAADSAG